ncbi:hypothetical protein HDV05_004858 [Chytridiales sp. JEL 0842]|nr:hypothetical protein HDV05_004858 [Chytridiales sp. JEL 0842]
MVIRIIATILLALLVLNVSAQRSNLAPLEPRAGTYYLGAWYSRPTGDTPSAMNARLGRRNLTFFQADFDINDDPTARSPGPQINITDEVLQHIDETGTDAMVYWTVYPKGGLQNITTDVLDDLTNRISFAIQGGRGVFLRFAPEMNGNWFRYGQQPDLFKATWRMVVTHIRSRLGANARRVAFIWAPNSGNGYPFPGGVFENKTWTATLNSTSDPYSPYYPGDDVVDWVGLSTYHYGSHWPWRQNVLPATMQLHGMIRGNVTPPASWARAGTSFGNYDFYDMFSGSGRGIRGRFRPARNVSAGGKPFIIAEMGATYHYGWNPEVWPNSPDYNATRLPPNQVSNITKMAIKRNWWRQAFEFARRHPKVKAICTFEFVKPEEDTLRDFTNFGLPIGADPAVTDDAEIAAAFMEDAVRQNITWASPASLVSSRPKPTETVPDNNASVTEIPTLTPGARASAAGLVPAFGFMLWTLTISSIVGLSLL